MQKFVHYLSPALATEVEAPPRRRVAGTSCRPFVLDPPIQYYSFLPLLIPTSTCPKRLREDICHSPASVPPPGGPLRRRGFLGGSETVLYSDGLLGTVGAATAYPLGFCERLFSAKTVMLQSFVSYFVIFANVSLYIDTP